MNAQYALRSMLRGGSGGGVALLCLLAVALLAPGPLSARTWTSGTFMIEAEFVQVQGEKVTLKRPDGQLVEVPLGKLSPADRLFIKRTAKPAVPMGGNPDQPAPEPMARPIGPGALTEPPKVDSAEFQAAIDGYWGALKNHDLAEAERKLDAARELALEGGDAAALTKVEAHFQAIEQFWTTFKQNAARLAGGGELQVGSELVAIVEAEGGRLVVRALGKNCRFAINNYPSIPAKLAVAVVGPKGGIVTLFRALESEKTDPDRWRAAAGTAPGGVNNGVFGGEPPPAFGGVAKPKPTKKLPIPSAAERDSAKKELTDLFGKDITAAKTPAAKFALAKQWFELANQTYPQEPASCFVMINEASDMAAAIGNVVAGSEAAQWLIDRFEIDEPLKVHLSFLAKTARTANDPQQATVAVRWSMELADAAASAGKFDMLEAIMTTAQAAARVTRSKELLQTVLDKKKSLDEAQAAEGEIAQVRQALAATPDDPPANHKLGLYLAGIKHDWKTALPHLAKSNDPAFAAAANLDLAGPTDPAKQVEAADAWWNLSEASKGSTQTLLTDRATHWYRQALPKLSGLAKIKVEKRLAPKM